MRKRLEHRGLPPVEIGRCCGQKRVLPIVKVTVAALHFSEGPVCDSGGKFERPRILVRKEGERVDRLGCALNIDGIRPVVIIAGTPCFFKEDPFEIVVAPFHLWTETVVPGRVLIPLEAVEIVSGMEIIDPVVLGILSIPPGSVFTLSAARIEDRLARDLEVFGTFAMFPGAREQAGSEQVGIMNGILEDGRVAQTGATLGLLFGQSQNPATDAFRDIQAPDLSQLLIGFEICLADQP